MNLFKVNFWSNCFASKLILIFGLLGFSSASFGCSIDVGDPNFVRSRFVSALVKHFKVSPAQASKSLLSVNDFEFAVPLTADCDGLFSAYMVSAFRISKKVGKTSCTTSGLAVQLGFDFTTPIKIQETDSNC